jgi:hypothetical protein
LFDTLSQALPLIDQKIQQQQKQQFQRSQSVYISHPKEKAKELQGRRPLPHTPHKPSQPQNHVLNSSSAQGVCGIASTNGPTPLFPMQRAPTSRHQQRNISPRRIQTAPLPLPQNLSQAPNQNIPKPITELFDTFRGTQEDGEDALDGFDVSEWTNAAIKAKARAQQEIKNPTKETWDDDFDLGESDMSQLAVPSHVLQAQQALRSDAENLKKFALHVEGLRIFLPPLNFTIVVLIDDTTDSRIHPNRSQDILQYSQTIVRWTP